LLFLVTEVFYPALIHADDLVLMAKEETVLQGMIDRLIEI
jgi:hypothetical protein